MNPVCGMLLSRSSCFWLALVGLVASVAGLQVNPERHWVVLVAGSSGYWNYRHQADVCHAYHVARDAGIPESQIIVMSFDDVANDPSNPFPGKLFNKPTPAGTPGKDVYAGCKIDYRGENVTAAKFLAVLTGNETAAGGPVLKSDENDHVFLNFADHGGTGIIAFPNDPVLSQGELLSALQTMHANKMYNRLVFYVEACESGSMFEGTLPTDINIYVTTASNADESSWGCYCPPDDTVDGKSLGTCLGDLYSVNWMEDCDTAGMKQTLNEQFLTVRKLTNMSHVMQYGDVSWTSEPIGHYEGNMDGSSVYATCDNHPDNHPELQQQRPARAGLVAAPNIPLHLAQSKRKRAMEAWTRMEEAQGSDPDVDEVLARVALAEDVINAAEEEIGQLRARVRADVFFRRLIRVINPMEVSERLMAAQQDSFMHDQFSLTCDDTCCEPVMEEFRVQCGGFSDYSLIYSRVLVNLCSVLVDPLPVKVALRAICD